MENDKKAKKSFILKTVYSMGSKTVDSKCVWWFNQPKIPAKLKK